MAILPGLELLWNETLGDPAVTVAILDGPVDVGHPSLTQAKLATLPTLVAPTVDDGLACRHGTYVASLIFGQHDGPVPGIAPGCRGMLVPVYATRHGQELPTCDQLDLAEAIAQAQHAGAQVISISGGVFAPSGRAHPHLAGVIQECARRNVLIVAAAGNDGCACPHVPAALDSVLAVGAMDAQGEPLRSSNWGGSYSYQGIVAPGHDLLGAQPGGGTARLSGTSSATALVSGVVALLLSLQVRRGLRPDPHQVREALLHSALDCRTRLAWDCPRLLVGRLNLEGAMKILFKETVIMSIPSNPLSTEPRSAAAQAFPNRSATSSGVSACADVMPSTCGCNANLAPVYVLGNIDVSLHSDAREASLREYAKAQLTGKDQALGDSLGADVFAQEALLKLIENEPHIASSVDWLLKIDDAPVYAIVPQGPFADAAYKKLAELLKLRNQHKRVSFPGVVAGQTRLRTGQTVPTLVPELRGIREWVTQDLVLGLTQRPADGGNAVDAFLRKIENELRNPGVLPQHRALNYAVTCAVKNIKMEIPNKKDANKAILMELDGVNVERSPFVRTDSDCWDVDIYFFYPYVLNQASQHITTDRMVFRFTVDVSDIVPVTVAKVVGQHVR